MKRTLVAVVGLLLVRPAWLGALPNPGPLRFVGPTPAANSLVTSGTAGVALDATCTFDPSTLAVSLNGVAIPASQFLPFSACVNGRKTSQTATVALPLPNGTIASAPTSLNARSAGTFSGSGTGDGLSWNFDGGAAPASGSSVTATFNAAGQFTVRLRSTKTEALAASGLDTGALATAQQQFQGGDPTPDSRLVTVVMPPDVDFRNYETGLVHPLALSAGGDRLYAINNPEGRLSIFNVGADGSLAFAGDVAVGVEPVSLGVRPGTNEVWVVNHLSDSVSVVDVVARKLLATIAVGDEPTDVAFASGHAFVSLAGNEDRVKVYDPATRAQITAIDLVDLANNRAGDDPRALAVNAAGTEVYAVMLESGNRTTALFTGLVTSGGGPPAPSPPRNSALGAAPAVGLIVKFNSANGRWEDETGKNWSSKVNFTLPDTDVFVLSAPTPAILRTVNGVGTILFDGAVSPATGELWVPNTDARNLVRFEPNLRGHLVQSRITRVNTTTGAVSAVVDLNSHINYTVSPGSAAEIANSLAQPGPGVFTANGATYYLAAFGSGKVGVLNAAGTVTDRIVVGGGPSGLALKESVQRLYVLNRFDNTISIVDTGSKTEIARTGVAGAARFDPSPDVIKGGRRFLYDAQITSGHGDIACATCHVFSNFDNIGWDLGDPGGDFLAYTNAPWVHFAPVGPSTNGFDPMKGPMTTQTLRGLKNLEPFHWRGDRQNFQAFNHAFVGLMGMRGFCSVSVATSCTKGSDCPVGELCLGLTPADMDAYTNFIMTVNFPPNPYRNLDDSMPNAITVPSQNGGGQTAPGNPNNGATIFSNASPPLDGGAFQCATCHTLPTGTSRNLFNGGLEGESQDFKIPELRNMYEKIGFDVIRPNLQSNNATNIGRSAQKKGFGFLHDGSVSLTEFLAAPVFNSTTQQELDLFAFMLAFSTESRPAIGRQVTVDVNNKTNGTVVTNINILIAEATVGHCDLIAKGVVDGTAKGWVYDPGLNKLVPDSLLETPLTEADLRTAIVAGDVLTYTGVPPGSGERLGIDRDRDGWLDRTELVFGTDPADPRSNPWKF
jgi:YVTN family beta-propeller protein